MKRPLDTRSNRSFSRLRPGLWLLLPGILLFSSCGTASEGIARAEGPAWGGYSPPESPAETGGEGPAGGPAPEEAAEVPMEAQEPEEAEESPALPDLPALSDLIDDDPAEAAAPPADIFQDPEEDWEYLEAPFDFAEAFEEPSPPPEPPLAAFPEPPAPVFPDPEPPVETAAAGTGETLPEPPAPEEAPPPASPAVPPAVPPSPPPYIRPAEEYAAPPVRESVPLPPIPEPPARTPPVEIPEPGIFYSRTVRATVGQLVEIPFLGTGWVYLGELGSRPGIVYASRRLDPEGQSFVFRTEVAGTYGLKFYKQDFVRDYILNDHVQVIVGEPPEAAALGWFNPAVDRGRVVAEPRWPLEAAALGRNAGPQAAEDRGPQGGTGRAAAGPQVIAAQGGTGRAQTAAEVLGGTDGEVQGPDTGPGGDAAAPVQAPAPGEGAALAQPAVAVRGPAAGPPDQDAGPADLRPGDYPERARQEFEAGRVASAISILDQFREHYPSGSDEAWWLYGQFYEANSPSRDIRSALDYYRRLVREYPQSRRYNDARRRIAYLERYYINIR